MEVHCSRPVVSCARAGCLRCGCAGQCGRWTRDILLTNAGLRFDSRVTFCGQFAMFYRVCDIPLFTSVLRSKVPIKLHTLWGVWSMESEHNIVIIPIQRSISACTSACETGAFFIPSLSWWDKLLRSARDGLRPIAERALHGMGVTQPYNIQTPG